MTDSRSYFPHVCSLIVFWDVTKSSFPGMSTNPHESLSEHFFDKKILPVLSTLNLQSLLPSYKSGELVILVFFLRVSTYTDRFSFRQIKMILFPALYHF